MLKEISQEESVFDDAKLLFSFEFPNPCEYNLADSSPRPIRANAFSLQKLATKITTKCLDITSRIE